MLELDVVDRRGAVKLDVSLRVEPGCLALAGPSGAGKSTLLEIVAGLRAPLRGRVACGGETWLDSERRRSIPPERRRCGYVLQDGALFPHLSALENVAFPLAGVERRERHRRAHELLERFGLGTRARARARELSGGEQRRVALARALARDPLVLLLDEPLTGLDASTRAHVARELGAAIAATCVPAVLVTHDLAEAAALADEIAVLERGLIVQRGSHAELARAPASAFVAEASGASVLAGEASAGPDGLTLVNLEGGARLLSTDSASGPVAASVHPWEIALEPPGAAGGGSAQNRLGGRVASVVTIGNRVRVALDVGQPLVAEVTEAAVRSLELAPGVPAVASWKATATRLTPR